MSDVIDRLLARDDIDTGYPATDSDIDALSRRFDAPPPAALVEMWRKSDGIGLPRLDAHLIGPGEARQLITEAAWGDDNLIERGLLPVLDDHESNYLLVNLRKPLAFRLTYLPHDDGSRLLYRSFESCVADLLRVIESDQGLRRHLYSADGDYAPDTPRSEKDQETARALMRTAGQHEEWNHAAQLLDSSNLQEWATLLETDHFVRRDVRERMRKMTSPAIREMLRQDDAAFEAFANWVADLARRAGLDVGRRERDALQIGGQWINLDAFFYRRNIPSAGPRLIAWVSDLIARRNPHDRAGHFMSD